MSLADKKIAFVGGGMMGTGGDRWFADGRFASV